MRFKRNLASLILVLSFSPSPLLFQEIKFERISVDKGLSHSSVFSIYQDSKGFMWFGTLDGLNKYDGYNFSVFKNSSADSNSITHNTVFKVFEDSENNIWIGTLGGGLNKYDIKNERFSSFLHDPNNEHSISNNNIRSIFEDKSGDLWIGTDDGLNLFDSPNKIFRRFVHDPENTSSISNNTIWSIFQDSKDFIWIGTYNGLNRIDLTYSEIEFEKFFAISNDPNSLSHNYIWSICEDKDENLWIGTDYGLNKLIYEENRFERYFVEDGLSHNKIWSLFKDENNNLWIGTLGGGINKLVNTNGSISISSYKNNIYNNYSISHDYVWSIFEDRSGVLWIATEIGLNKHDETRFKFNLLRNIPGDDNSLNSNEITAIFKDSFGNIWIGTRNGLNKYNASDNKILRYTSSNPNNKISDNYVRAIYEAPSEEGILWVGTNKGLNRINLKSNSLKVFLHDYSKTNSISNNTITHIIEDSKKNLWIGTLGGLNKLKRKHEAFEIYFQDAKKNSLSDNYVFAIVEDSDMNLWIGTGKGLNKYRGSTDLFECYYSDNNNSNSISNNFISDIYIDKNNILWICTNGGLNKYDIKRNKFSVYTENEGLPSNAVVGVEEDDYGILWLSTNNGLSMFNPNKETFQNYSIGDGLQSKQFTGGATFKSIEGEMYFGGINGLNSFMPNLITNNFKIPPIAITQFFIHNQEIGIGNGSPLTVSIPYTKKIELSHTDNNFSFGFSALHYSYPNENHYKYMLRGVDRDWVMVGNQRFANYTNIDPGEYIFTVKGSNNDGIWNTVGSSLGIVVKPPFWQTWWFISLVLTLLIYLTVIFFQFRTKNLLALERLRLKIAEDLHDDVGTRLTEISMLTDIIYHSESDIENPNRNTIKKIGGIARLLIDNMSDIVWLINPKRDSVYELFLKLRDTYEELLSSSNINFHINDFKSLEGIKLPIEVRKNIYLLFKEAINNSIKHGKCSEISINTQLKSKMLRVTLYDNGIGFNLNKDVSGNGLQNMVHRANLIDGELTINSKIGSGTEIVYRGKV